MGLINCPSCGQRQSEENVECINCGTPLNNLIGTQNPVKNMKDGEICCPHCGHIQSRSIELCKNCGKSMRTVLKIQKRDIAGTAIWICAAVLGVLFAIYCEVSLGILITVVCAGFAIVKYERIDRAIHNAGLLLDRVNEERLYRESLPQTLLFGLQGVPGISGECINLLLDQKRVQLIFQEKEIERFLPFSQIVSYGVVTREEYVKGSVLTGAAIGGAIGGDTGAIVGAMAAKEGTIMYRKYFEINYRTKSGSLSKIECRYKGLNETHIEQIAPAFKEAVGICKHLNSNKHPVKQSDYL
ncbi:zinc ribbon domain-containing protein [Flavonifractor plautii]|uniref:zinc ribbon domain-containing protein n=1 Tax=Flavonifractor plautii TaxID=292800 RepID=UPI0019204ADD|nr:zinc ribbon domain-containing protein [Flavonifractor plautii]MDC0820753.1 zinc ribbon domain-containing protein [Flavonifractor plautii]